MRAAAGAKSRSFCCCCIVHCNPKTKVNRVLKPGGKLITTVWEELQMMTTIRNIMTEVLGQAPPAPPINPLSMREDGLVQHNAIILFVF